MCEYMCITWLCHGNSKTAQLTGTVRYSSIQNYTSNQTGAIIIDPIPTVQ